MEDLTIYNGYTTMDMDVIRGKLYIHLYDDSGLGCEYDDADIELKKEDAQKIYEFLGEYLSMPH